MADSTEVDELVVTELSDTNPTALEAGRTESVDLSDVAVTRATLEPEWGAEADHDGAEAAYCQNAHDIYVVSGTLGLELDDGTQTEIAAGCAATIPPGHRGWTVGDERLVYLEFDPSE
ncbi:hypothetical protein C5B91_17715 [Haloferax sp. Atlit-10N]|uniref:Cupin 2 conserved barrel domain-containing protein n=1 Tax=Haloferax prahovense (strain DSM 18310 / JCM 13924 / TL6) TaxID=1227461 RepID=M0FVY7_HALPT|nr:MULTISPECIES: hypothetical protein [Haloferax]ELZ63417.1 hypothetical protein C457_19288 [Haloferax prahovense DSM 18310]RDZ39727.1 hypothetical protein C5B86_18345 [Haloferax sp. Atlit-19N]RDZ39851.1 hypothetical protein C5B87_18250 [Haloferax sp. Atlit-16N]RDZ56623.1 hypothetical protein C5B91_17715 [Haloferax sp. Atlit-10N]